MIEVEKKFRLSDALVAKLTSGATKLGTKELHDTYYDDAAWTLSTKDWWLRRRGDAWELKVGDPHLPPFGIRPTDEYEELTDERAIVERLGLPAGESLGDGLAAGLVPFVTIVTTRTTYRLGEFTIEVDDVSFPEGDGYNLVEIELLTEDADEATEKIQQLAERLGLPCDPVKGKLQEYCERHRPDHVAAMKKAGLIVA